MLVPIDSVAEAARTQALSVFVERYPDPALTLWVANVPPDQALDDERSTLQSTMDEDAFRNIFVLAARRSHVAWLRKSERNIFQNIISVGRAPTNDVQIPLKTVSKIHAVFSLVGDRWRVADRGARNGLSVNEVQVDPREPVKLKDGDILKFGRGVEGTFHQPKGLYSFLRNLL